MKNLAKYLILIAICVVVTISFPAKMAFGADPPNVHVHCAISVTVDDIVEWEPANFAPIVLANITAQNSAPEDNKPLTLWTNCNVELGADNTAAARLTDGNDVLVTNYKLSTDGDGAATSGADANAIAASHDYGGADHFALYSSFLTTELAITHVSGDGNVEVTLYAQATNATNEVSDSGDYTATQTITAIWVSDD